MLLLEKRDGGFDSIDQRVHFLRRVVVRAVPEMPRQRISGCVQWWPAR
jgi:hypothetical protein